MPDLVFLGGPDAEESVDSTTIPDIVFIHGYGSDSQSWVGTSPALFSMGRCWALDLPGHGKAWAEKPAATIEGLVDQIEGIIFSVPGRPVHLVGHSIGGLMAMLLAQRQTDHVASLVLLAPAGLGGGVNAAFIKNYPELTTEPDTLSQLRALVYNERLIPDVFAQLALSQLNREGVRQSLSDLGALLLQSEEEINRLAIATARTTLPRLLVWGEQDKINPFNATDKIRFGGVWHVLDKCGHLPHIEHRVAVNKYITEFLLTLNN